MDIRPMQFINHRLRIGITFGPHDVRADDVGLPVEPILNNTVNGDIVLPVTIFYR